MHVTVFGIGYVGLVQAAVLADVGHDVVCVDIDANKIEALRSGAVPIYEPGLEELVERNLAENRLHFTTDANAGIEHGELQFIAVGTPPDEDGSADLKYVLAVAHTIASAMTAPKIVVNKSTVPVGTADRVRDTMSATLAGRGAEIPFHVVSNPEFLKEGAAVEDCMRPDRIVIGTDDSYALEKLRQLYAPLNRNHDRLLAMDVRSAELTKYAANCLLATKISFMNEMANLAERLGADIESVRRGIGSDPRIGYHFIYPGCGYGGSCFPKDVKALVRTAQQSQFEPKLLNAVEAVNASQKQVLFERIHRFFDGDLRDRTVALWGLAFKPNTDDMREASSRVLMERLWQAGARVRAFDPHAADETRRIYGDRPDLELVDSMEAALEGADVLAICTEWRQFRAADLDHVRDALRHPAIFDGRNLYDPKTVRAAGLHYYAIGRGDSVVTTTG